MAVLLDWQDFIYPFLQVEIRIFSVVSVEISDLGCIEYP